MRSAFCIAVLAPCVSLALLGQGTPNTPRNLSLRDCMELALKRNRELQIERYNPRVAQLSLKEAYGAFDPVFFMDARRLHSTSDVAFDPEDFSRDAQYDADSHEVKTGFTGRLPTGMTYELSGLYANSSGLRNSLNFDSYNLNAGISVSQPLLKDFWIDAERMTIKVNKRNLRITELGVEHLVTDVLCRVQLAYAEWVYAREQVTIKEELLTVRQNLNEAIAQKVAAGALPSLEQKLTQAEVARVQADLLAARNAVGLAENNLKSLFGDDFVHSLDTQLTPTDRLMAVPEPFSTRDSWQRGLAERRDLAQLRLEFEQTGTIRSYRYNQLFPSLNVVAGYQRRGASTDQVIPPAEGRASSSMAFGQIRDGDSPSDMVGVVFAIPLSRKAELSRYRASKELQEQASARVKQMEEVVLREVDDAIKNARSSYERIAATRQAAEFAQAALDVEQQKLAVGSTTLFFVFELQEKLATARAEATRAQADYQIALAQLYFAEGSTLERAKVSVEVK